MSQSGNACDDGGHARAGGGVSSPWPTTRGGSRSGAPRGGRETEAKGRETKASGFPAEFAAEHFCPDAPGDEGEDDKMPPLNDPDSSDDEADNAGGGENKIQALSTSSNTATKETWTSF